MEKITYLIITLATAFIGFLTANFGFEYLSQTRTFEQTFAIVNLLVLMAILLASSLYFTISKFKNATA